MTDHTQTAEASATLDTQSPKAGTGESGPTLSRSLLAGLLRLAADERLPIRFQARGGSMRPFIRDGDTITVSPLPHPVPRFGDVVAFLHPASDQVIVHRVIRRRAGQFWMKGDSVGEGEGPVDGGRILGRVSRLERGGRPRRLGLGPERVLIAGVARSPLLSRILRSVRRILIGLFGRQSPPSQSDSGHPGNVDGNCQPSPQRTIP